MMDWRMNGFGGFFSGVSSTRFRKPKLNESGRQPREKSPNPVDPFFPPAKGLMFHEERCERWIHFSSGDSLEGGIIVYFWNERNFLIFGEIICQVKMLYNLENMAKGSVPFFKRKGAAIFSQRVDTLILL